jgi:hypothetical protein
VPAYVRGFVVCDGCGKTATATAQVSTRHDFELWWDLPEGWQLFGRGRGNVAVYCQPSCNKHRAVMGYPDQEGKRKQAPNAFDARTLDKIYELIESAAGSTSADNVLAAIEAVLMAWRQREAVA